MAQRNGRIQEFATTLRMQSSAGPIFCDKYGDKGPYSEIKGAAPMFEGLYSDVYLSSLDPRDRAKLYEACQPGPRERKRQPIWKYEYEAGRFEGGNEIGWIDFLEGKRSGLPDAGAPRLLCAHSLEPERHPRRQKDAGYAPI